MPFISYAQNFEDVMLYRALKHVPKGFYIDVGAHDPEFQSVTRAFYERGWHGINIEPVPSLHKRLAEVRPRDINLMLAASDSTGETTLYQFSDTGLSTTSAEIADAHEASGFGGSPIVCQQQTLQQICDEHAKEDIHFLKVDVEGSEEAVLRGHDFGRYRPWIVVVESTFPLSTDQHYAAWEALLVDAGYRYTYFDGLNRFYVADEHNLLAEHLRTPPNVFDDFIRATEIDSSNEVSSRLMVANNRVIGLQRQVENLASLDEIRTIARAMGEYSQQVSRLVSQLTAHNQQQNSLLAEQVAQLTASVEHKQSRLLALSEENALLREDLLSLRSSLSWRLTSPLRAVRRMIRSQVR